MIGHAGHPEVEGTMGQADDGIHLSEDGAAYLVPPISGWMERTTKDNKGS
jgi:4-hydroxy-3-methylbut-2-enyl diphosphate reductase IspH